MIGRLILASMLLAAVACGPVTGRPVERQDAGVDAPGLKLRHQIMIRYDDQLQVFEGFMILRGDAFVVRAFAGPGIDLFTVRRDGPRHVEQAHVPGLESRLDLAAVGADIARVYLPGCTAPKTGGERACAFGDEPLTEELDAEGRLVGRRFPAAHGIGVKVRYEEFETLAGLELARKITLSWGASANEMVIRLLSAERVEDIDADLLLIED